MEKEDHGTLASDLLSKADELLEQLRSRGHGSLIEGLRLARDECYTKVLKLNGVAEAERSVTEELVAAVERLKSEIQRSQALLHG